MVQGVATFQVGGSVHGMGSAVSASSHHVRALHGRVGRPPDHHVPQDGGDRREDCLPATTNQGFFHVMYRMYRRNAKAGKDHTCTRDAVELATSSMLLPLRMADTESGGQQRATCTGLLSKPSW